MRSLNAFRGQPKCIPESSGADACALFCKKPPARPSPFELDGVSVVIDGLAFAPILVVSVPQSGNAEINFQVPLERNASLRSVTPNSPGGISVLVNLNVVATQTPVPPPESGGFFLDQNGNMLAQDVTPRPLFSTHIGLMINPTSLREFLGNPSLRQLLRNADAGNPANCLPQSTCKRGCIWQVNGTRRSISSPLSWLA